MPDADAGVLAGQALAGGMANAGKVVLLGDAVHRPVGPHTATVHALLDHLAAVGFTGSPRVRGYTDGRSVLDFVPGEVGLPPYPAWTATTEVLTSVARLQRALHDATRSFVVPADAVWDRTLSPQARLEPGADVVVGHNDLCVENVVARDGRAVAFIDFDFAAPTDALWDVAIAARHWVPAWAPVDLTDGRVGVDQVARFAAYCDAYGDLDTSARGRVVEHLLAFLDRALGQVAERAAAGRAGYVEVWEAGYEARNRRAHAWVDVNQDALAAA